MSAANAPIDTARPHWAIGCYGGPD
ncbi:MAG: hypothetical protein QOF28_2217, partial [Actinomycetota bacterium]|nr:hypothetical protein [Actinomycetota bacterium]